MPKFQYKAVNMSGHTLDGVFEGKDRDAVVMMLRGKSYFPLEIKTVASGSASMSGDLSKKIKIKDLSLFCQQFATILGSGIAVGQALDIMQQQTESKKLQAVLKDVYEKVLTGHSLTEAFSDHADKFPTVFVSMLAVGEVSGTLEACLNRLYGYFKQESSLTAKFRTAMVYPSIVACLAVAIVTYLLIAVVPTFKGIFEGAGAALPAPTLALLSISDFMQHNWLILLIAVVAGALIFQIMMKTESSRAELDRIALKIPAFGQLSQKLMVSRFTRTLGSMTASGVPLTQALEITSRVISNKYVEKQLLKASEAIQQGQPLYKPLSDIQQFPVMVTSMTRLGEESGQLDYMLEQTAQYYDSETETAIARVTAAIEPAIIIAMAVVVLFILLAILIPVFRMSSLIH